MAGTCNCHTGGSDGFRGSHVIRTGIDYHASTTNAVPARGLPSWKHMRIKKKYGTDKTDALPAVSRLEKYLQSEPGRLAVHAVIKAGLRLSGNPCGGGIPECMENLGRTQQ